MKNQYVIIRARGAGVFAGTLEAKEGSEVIGRLRESYNMEARS